MSMGCIYRIVHAVDDSDKSFGNKSYQERAEENSFEVCREHLDELLAKLKITDLDKKKCFDTLDELILLGADAIDAYIAQPHIVKKTLENSNPKAIKKLTEFFTEEDLAESKKTYSSFKSNTLKPQMYA